MSRRAALCVRLLGLQDLLSSRLQWQDLAAANSFPGPDVGLQAVWVRVAHLPPANSGFLHSDILSFSPSVTENRKLR